MKLILQRLNQDQKKILHVDFEGNELNPKIKEMLNKIKEKTLFLKILGSYPYADMI